MHHCGQFDPLSDNYLIAGCKSGLIHLYDTESRALLQTYEKVHGGLVSLAWVPGTPGNFVSASDKVGVIRVWCAIRLGGGGRRLAGRGWGWVGVGGGRR